MNSKFQQLLQSLTKSTIQTLSINSNSRILQTFSGVWNIIKSLRCWNGLKVHIPVSMSILIKCQKSSAVLNNFPCLMKCILIWLYPQSLAHGFFEHSDKFGVTRFQQFEKKKTSQLYTHAVCLTTGTCLSMNTTFWTPKIIEIPSSLTFCQPCLPPLPSDRVAGWGAWRRRSWIHVFFPDLCHSAHPGIDT